MLPDFSAIVYAVNDGCAVGSRRDNDFVALVERAARRFRKFGRFGSGQLVSGFGDVTVELALLRGVGGDGRFRVDSDGGIGSAGLPLAAIHAVVERGSGRATMIDVPATTSPLAREKVGVATASAACVTVVISSIFAAFWL